MKIAICGNDFFNIKQIKRVLYIFSNFKKLNLVVDVIDSNTDFLNISKNYALIFISFEIQSNIYLAQRLYKNKSQIPIIVFSKNPCHAAEAFKINAYNFLQMPLCEDFLLKILENFFNTFLLTPLILSDGFENVCINANDIFYLEANNKHCYIHLTNQQFHCNKTMARVFSVLPQGKFAKISRSFVVNCDYITRFCSEYIILKNGVVLYPSRHFYKTFKSDYNTFKMPKIP